MTDAATDGFIGKIIDVADNSTTIGHCIVRAMSVTVALSAHACPILNGATNYWTFAASAAILDKIECFDVMVDNLIIDPNDSGTGKFLLIYKPL
jgi:hypothetical protein